MSDRRRLYVSICAVCVFGGSAYLSFELYMYNIIMYGCECVCVFENLFVSGCAVVQKCEHTHGYC